MNHAVVSIIGLRFTIGHVHQIEIAMMLPHHGFIDTRLAYKTWNLHVVDEKFTMFSKTRCSTFDTNLDLLNSIKMSATDSVTEIVGIGDRIAKVLARSDIRTVGDLANADISGLTIPSTSVEKLQKLAREYIGQGGSSPMPSAPKMQLGSTSYQTANPEDVYERYVISEHSWNELVAKAPHPQTKKLQNMVINELNIVPSTPLSAVTMICTWDDDDELFEAHFSPQFIYHFNPELPPLVVAIRPEDYDGLVNQAVLSNTLAEVELMRPA